MHSAWPTIWDIALTILRWIAGLGVGVLLGLIIATLQTLVPGEQGSKRLNTWLTVAPLDFLRALPIIALVPLVQMISISERWKVALIAWAVMFPMYLSMRQARLRSLVDTELALNAAGLSSLDIFRNYKLPKALGGLLKGVEISIGIAWLSVVAAEWVGTFSEGFWAGGLGYKITKAHEANNWSSMLICLALFGLLGTSTAWTWRILFTKERALANGFNPLRNDEE